jgi:hypothetical protein
VAEVKIVDLWGVYSGSCYIIFMWASVLKCGSVASGG